MLPDYLQQQAYQYRLAKLKRPVNPLDWITSNFYLYDTGNLITLYDCQRRPLELALSRDANGNYKYNTVLWSWPKKSAKSSVISAVCDYVAESRTHASVKLVANDLKQADSRVGYYLRESILIGQKHGKRQGIAITPSGYKVSYPNGAKVECVPIDPSGEAGGNDDLIVYSELWGWKSKAHQRMWSEMTLSPNKWGNSQRWIDTYAGITGESPILEQLYDVGKVQGVKVWDDLEVYVNDSAKMLTVWVTQPMFPWQTAEYYAEQASTLTPSEFERMHRNQWASSQEAFVPIEWWDACKADLPPLEPKQSIILGVDAAVENDCFAIVGVTITTRDGVKVPQVRYVKVWTPPKNGQIDFSAVEAELTRLIDTYSITCISYDPYQMADMAQRLGHRAFWFEFKQGAPRLMADKQLFDIIRDRRIEQNGDMVLRQHMLNADRKPDDDKLRIIKRAESQKIDSVVALSMACERALYYNLG